MQIEKLLEEQEKEFEKSELCKRITTTEMYAINHGFPEWKGETVMDWHKQSLKQFIDGLVAEIEKMIVHRPDELIELNKNSPNTLAEIAYNNGIGYCEAMDKVLEHLKEIRKQVELEVVDNTNTDTNS